MGKAKTRRRPIRRKKSRKTRRTGRGKSSNLERTLLVRNTIVNDSDSSQRTPQERGLIASANEKLKEEDVGNTALSRSPLHKSKKTTLRSPSKLRKVINAKTPPKTPPKTRRCLPRRRTRRPRSTLRNRFGPRAGPTLTVPCTILG